MPIDKAAMDEYGAITYILLQKMPDYSAVLLWWDAPNVQLGAAAPSHLFFNMGQWDLVREAAEAWPGQPPVV